MVHDSLFPQLLLATAAVIGTVVVIERHLLAAIRTGKLIGGEIFPYLKRVCPPGSIDRSHIKKRAVAC
jgi:hypothetical protein